MITVTELYTYPIKSTSGIALTECEVQPIGLAQDRRRAVVDAATNRILTGRDYPALLGLTTTLTAQELLVQGPHTAIAMPLTPSDGASCTVKLWAEEQHPGIRYSETVNRWFSDVLGVDCYVIYMGKGCRRDLPTGMASGYTGNPGDAVSYADDYPLLLASEASLADLNSRLATPVTFQRFRPNIVLRGATAYQEDGWRRVRIGTCEFEYAQQCPRCVMTTIDPTTKTKDSRQEPLRTLATYRKAPGGGAPFGVQLVPRQLGTIAIGDTVEVLEA